MARKESRKRSKATKVAENAKKGSSSAKRRRSDDKIIDVPMPASSASDVSEEEIGGVYREPSMYDNLLKALGSGSDKLAKLYMRRQREQEGLSDDDDDEEEEQEEEEDEDGGPDSAGVSDKEDDHEGYEITGPEPANVDHGEEAASEDEEESYDGHDADDDKHNCDTANKTKDTSSFQLHLTRTLKSEEVDDLTKKKWKFKWEMPATNIPVSKWIGTSEHFMKEVSSDLCYGLKEKLFKHWLNIFGTQGSGDFHSSKQRLFFSLCNSYQDIMHCNKKPFYLKGLEEDSSIMDAYIMHALNHIYRTRDLVTKNDAKQKKNEDSKKEDILYGGSFLDHGFTRPKVMFLLPLRSIALRVIKRLIQLTPSSDKTNVEYFDRFSEEFGAEDAEDDVSKNDASSKSQKSVKPTDFQLLFGGNHDDHFVVGIKFTKKSIKLYSDFYSSDIIIASPLGLVTKIGEAEIDKDKDVDYLSSIEVLIVDHADVIAMQNWSHVNTVIEQLNCTPSKQHGTDIMRIRPWYLDGQARFYRQTILLSSFLNPEMNALFNRLCVNYEGKVKLLTEHKGVLPKVLLQVRKVYERFDAPSITEVDDARLDYFTKRVFPKIKDSLEGGTMLFISSYFEFVRIRNFLKSQNASFCLLGEYTKPSDISRARVWFFEGKRKIMLYTERAHFYHRYKIRGVQNLIVYSLPERKEFYPEIINMLEASKNIACSVLFSRFDHLRLERIVGTHAAKRMLSSDKDMFVFC
ncbi:U3 small nucleolar RNA-associated protein 25 [Dioscorea alata]|uniref:U3 small nucleolar RNA-associated protein 25 n=1 Tax=Dioscorea alata TaxID=55571 RepID=A0ACB7VCM4_DIOAL|nr:U3 small nucleolar RNA-associated protein 25 [Dioscorea alata]